MLGFRVSLRTRVEMLGKFSFVIDQTLSSNEVLQVCMLKDDSMKQIHDPSIQEDFSDQLG
jgi:hypothetical protein